MAPCLPWLASTLRDAAGWSPRSLADLGIVAWRAPGQLVESLPMIEHEVRAHKSTESFPREEQLAWKLAMVATDPVPVEAEVAEMVVNRLIDDAGVAAAALRRRPVANARAQALRHALPGGGDSAVRAIGAVRPGGATVLGCPSGMHVQPEWAAWANCVAVRELDFHDTFLAAEYSHPGDNIPPLLAVAQHIGCNGRDLVRAIATSYEVQVDLCRGISPARSSHRPRRPPRAVGSGGDRHAPRATNRGRLPGDRSSPPHDDRYPPVPQGCDIYMEGIRTRLCRKGCHRGCRPSDARGNLAGTDLRG